MQPARPPNGASARDYRALREDALRPDLIDDAGEVRSDRGSELHCASPRVSHEHDGPFQRSGTARIEFLLTAGRSAAPQPTILLQAHTLD